MLFKVTRTYDVVTQQSAEIGEFSDTGVIFEETEMRLKDLLKEVETLGYYENLQPNKDYQNLYSIESDIDYQQGTETREAVHIRGPSKAMKRLYSLLSAKGKNK